MDRINVGIIGTGYIGAAHIEAVRRLGYANVTAIVTRNMDKGSELCGRLGIPRVYTDYKELLADNEIDVVHNCTPNNMHFECNKNVILAGKHVLSEKPVAVNSQESRELLRLAEASALKHAVNFVYRHYSIIRHIKGMIEGGELGEIYAIHGSYLQDWLLHDTDYNWRVEADLGGPSRAVADIGSHWCDLAQFLSGQDIVEVFGDLMTFLPVRKKKIMDNPKEYVSVNVDTEDYGSVLLRFRNGARGSFTVSQVSAGRKVGLSIEIDGSKASVHWDQENAHMLWIGHRDRPNEILQAHPALLNEYGRSTGCIDPNRLERWPDAQKSMLDSFYRTILYGERPWHADFNQAHYIMKIIDAILASNRSGAWQKI